MIACGPPAVEQSQCGYVLCLHICSCLKEGCDFDSLINRQEARGAVERESGR